MTLKALLRTGTLATAIGLAASLSIPSFADTTAKLQAAQHTINIGQNRGMLVRLPQSITDVFIAETGIADVQVRSADSLYVFGKGPGETTLYATNKAGKVVYSATVRVAQNIDQIKSMLGLAMPGTAITVTPMNGMVLLTGTVATPTEVEEATRLVQAFVGDKQTIVNKLKTAMPIQVNLKVKIAEVSRELVKEFGFNFFTVDRTSGFQFGVTHGFSDFLNGTFVNARRAGGAFGFAGNLAGLDISSVLDVLEQDGFITTLAEPNLTALSGETASFLAGGEFPIAVAQDNNRVTIEFKEYGVGLAFTPTVLDGNRISMRVRPEVSELTDAGSIQVGSLRIPALATRRAETTVELGSGQSFMIGGLLRNSTNTSTEKTPLLGDLPVIGALFKSDKFKRNETELVIIITPMLVKPVSEHELQLPTDGFRAPPDVDRWLRGRTFAGVSGKEAPRPAVPAATSTTPPASSDGAAPGFTLN